MQKISFTKMSGAGNDFILIDKSSHRDIVLSNDFIQKICDRHYGVGADGLITISGSAKYDFDMEYFNADGSTGSLCGNGARCAINFASARLGLKNKVSFLSNGARYSGEIVGDQVLFYFNEPRNMKTKFKVKAAGQLINADYIDTGSPHIVINIKEIVKNPSNPGEFYDNINDVPVYSLGKEIRYLSEFAPAGTNVNFIDAVKGKLFIRTYERGVENETLSCGTGSAASAILSFLKGEVKVPVTLITHGGDELIVDFKFEDGKIKELSLTGPVKTSFTGELLLNNYL